jgi:hypothetical protein
MLVLEDWHMSFVDDIIKSGLCLTLIYTPVLLSLMATKRVYLPTVLPEHSKVLHLYFLNSDRHHVETRLKQMSEPYL